MTYSFENLTEFPEKEKIEKLFEQYKKEMLYLRNFSEKTLKSIKGSSIAGRDMSERCRQK